MKDCFGGDRVNIKNMDRVEAVRNSDGTFMFDMWSNNIHINIPRASFNGELEVLKSADGSDQLITIEN